MHTALFRFYCRFQRNQLLVHHRQMEAEVLSGQLVALLLDSSELNWFKLDFRTFLYRIGTGQN